MIKNRWEIIWHILFWFFSFWMLMQNFSFESVEVQVVNGERKEVYIRDYRMMYFFAISLFAKMVLVYSNIFWAFPSWLKTQNKVKFLTRLVGIFSTTILLEIALLEIYGAYSSEKIYKYYTSMWQLNALFYLFYFGISVAYVLGKNHLKNEKIKRQLLAEKLESELDFLKSQINPHFLFNTLNNLFAIAERKNHPELSNGIAELSNLMRYMLYDCKTDLVPVEKEIRLLESIIEMHQLRLDADDEVVISFNTQGNIAGKMIAPLILVPFVENAFKHGIQLGTSSFIKMNLEVKEEHLIFNIINSKSRMMNTGHEQHSGIGLTNVRRRLELIYPDKHKLNILDEPEVFKVSLTIYYNQKT